MKEENLTVASRRLINKIKKIFNRGLTLSPEAEHYVDSTFLQPSPDELAKMLADGTDSETETLLELIFFPGEDIQIELEPLLETACFSQADEDRVVAALTVEPLEATVFSPSRQLSLQLVMSAELAARFVSRLKIAVQIDERLIKAVGDHVAMEHQARLKVHLRNTRIVFDPERISFLCRFLERTDAKQRTMLACFDFILAFFGERPTGGDIYRELMEKKRFYLHSLQKALKAHRQLEKSNMETLMLQGIRFSFIDPADAREKIDWIDRISWAVYGRVDPCGLESDSVDLGEYSRRDGLEAIFHLLS